MEEYRYFRQGCCHFHKNKRIDVFIDMLKGLNN